MFYVYTEVMAQDVTEAKSATMNIFRKKNIFFSNHL